MEPCAMCGGDAVPVTVFGPVLHLNCRQCGAWLTREATADDDAELDGGDDERDLER